MRTLKNIAIRLARMLLFLVFGIPIIVAIPVFIIAYIISGKNLFYWTLEKHETLDSKLTELLSNDNK